MKYIVKAAIAVACVGLAWAAAVRIESPVESGRAASPASGVAVASAPPRAGHANAATAAASPAGDYYLSPYTQFHPIEEIDPNTHLAVEFQSVAIGDVTGDGRDDVVANTLTPSHRVYVFPQRANGLDMEHPLRFDHGSHVYLAGTELLLGDLNEDGVLDVLGATSNDSGALGTLHVLLSNGQGGLTQTFIPTSLERWFNAFLVDVDLDGHLDFIAHMSWRDDFNPACGTACTARRTFFGDGKGGFPRSTFEIMPKAAGPVLTRAGDLNGDGIPDLVTAGPEGYTSDEWTLQVTYHDTIGGYAPAVPLTEALWENDFGDFNHDGRTDLLTGQQRYGLYVRTQLVDGQFELPVFLPSGFMMNPGQLVADLDRDGADDVVSAMFDEPQTPVRLRIFLQRNGALTLSVPPS
ncbi:MAG TPA: VCBS repeat-containing protein, partial [Luteimonas sp.]|nr:VCBS repeat-containing protein [Luteimonas sp.]